MSFAAAIPFSRLTAAVLALVCAGCGPASLTDMDSAPLASSEEITAYVSGNTLRNVVGGGMYFAPDGKLVSVETQIDQLALGQWSVTPGTPSKLCLSPQRGAYVFGGEMQEFATEGFCYEVAPQRNGRAVMDARNAPEFVTGKMERGFSLAARYQKLKSKTGLR